MRQNSTLGFVAVLGALLACKSAEQRPAPESKPDPAATPTATALADPMAAWKAKLKARQPSTTVTIGELVKAYEANEVAADNKYKGRWLLVAGKVDSVKKDILDDAFVTIGSGKQFEVVQGQCYFDDSEKQALADLERGQTIGVVCKGDGLLMNVQLRECILMRHADGGVYAK